MGISNDWVARLVFDILSALLLFVVAAGGAFLPKYLSTRGKASGNERSFAFQLGNMLSAGVMLSACFCHLLADALPETQKAVPDFPLAPFLCALGCLLTLAADQYATHMSGRLHPHTNGSSLLKPDHVRSDSTNEAASNSHASPDNAHFLKTMPMHSSSNLLEVRTLEIDGLENSEEDRARVSFLTALFLGMALSLHSVLEGLALGAQQTIHASKNVLIAIAAHKGLAAYALGASLVDSQASTSRFWKVAGGFSLASPIGILVGFGLSEVSKGVGAASLSALASGTFLYVAMMEIIPGELSNSERILSKLIIMFLGFGAMSALAIWA